MGRSPGLQCNSPAGGTIEMIVVLDFYIIFSQQMAVWHLEEGVWVFLLLFFTPLIPTEAS